MFDKENKRDIVDRLNGAWFCEIGVKVTIPEENLIEAVNEIKRLREHVLEIEKDSAK